MDERTRVGHFEVELDPKGFMRSLLRHLTGALEDVIGAEDATSFVSIVSQNIGHQINDAYCRALQVDQLERRDLSAVLVDLKRRIEGDFFVIRETEDQLVLGNRACPFGDQVHDRPSLCMMTSGVFGVIAAQSQGYARVKLNHTIAAGHPGCRVTIYLNPNDDEGDGREYFRVDE